MVWHSRSRQCILTAVRTLHYNKLDKTILVLTISTILPALYKNNIFIVTLLGYTIQVMVSISKLYCCYTYLIYLLKSDDLCIIIFYY